MRTQILSLRLHSVFAVCIRVRHPVEETFQGDQDGLAPFPQPVGHVAKHRIRGIGGAVRADRAACQIATQCQTLAVTKNLVCGAADVRLHNGIQFSLYPRHVQLVQIAAWRSVFVTPRNCGGAQSLTQLQVARERPAVTIEHCFNAASHLTKSN